MQNLFKSLHIVAVISWMAGVLYLYRLVVYHVAEREEVVRARLAVMERRLWRAITLPAMVAAILFGGAMVALDPSLLRAHWLHSKLGLVALLVAATLYARRASRRLADGRAVASERHFRVANEIPTLLMILIVLLVVFKPF